MKPNAYLRYPKAIMQDHDIPEGERLMLGLLLSREYGNGDSVVVKLKQSRTTPELPAK